MDPHQIFLIPLLTNQLDVQTVCCLHITQIIRFALGVDRKATLMTSPNTYAHFALGNQIFPCLPVSQMGGRHQVERGQAWQRPLLHK